MTLTQEQRDNHAELLSDAIDKVGAPEWNNDGYFEHDDDFCDWVAAVVGEAIRIAPTACESYMRDYLADTYYAIKSTGEYA